MSQAALIFSHSISPRLQYVIDFIEHYYGVPFHITCDEISYLESEAACKINYGFKPLSAQEIYMPAHVLLFEDSIRQVKVECFKKDRYTAFFKSQCDWGFDLFAAVFYLITRYEEYLPHKKDTYGRFSHESSLAFRENFLQLPLVNIWLEDFRKQLKERNSDFAAVRSRFQFQPTYDIDMAWSFRNKGFVRNAGAIVYLALHARFKKISERIKVLKGKSEDPYDSYQWLHQLHHEFVLEPVYFFLMADTTGQYDKNILPSNPEFQKLVKDIADRNTIGLHPSWASGDRPGLLETEKKKLESIAGKDIPRSRQHYIRFDLPVTYRHLLSAGIREEYSMGYGTTNGFRASVATPFYWYDLERDERTSLLVHPFCFMDANAFYEDNLTPEQAMLELDHYLSTVRSVNGKLITIWHNSILGSDPEFDGWKEVYRKMVKKALSG